MDQAHYCCHLKPLQNVFKYIFTFIKCGRIKVYTWDFEGRDSLGAKSESFFSLLYISEFPENQTHVQKV